jgi:SAM-dependent methyltransferase
VVQKPVDQAWQAEAAEVYAGYAMYGQSLGEEQGVFAADGSSVPRSRRILEFVDERVGLAKEGRLLDVGCGNGVLLRAFGAMRPRWTMVGNDIGDRERRSIEAIPRVEALHVGDPAEAPGRFDLITLSHVLEHVPSPVTFLQVLREKLAPQGVIVVQVPALDQNPFDLLVADHCSHFTLETLTPLLRAGGLTCQVATSAWVRKELTLLAGAGFAPSRAVVASEASRIDHAIVAWLVDARNHAASAQARGLLGTSTSSAWLAAELGDSVEFFVDEDVARRQKPFLGRPVLAPDEVPRASTVYLPLPPHQAVPIAERLARRAPLDGRFVVPPPIRWRMSSQ